MKLHKMAKPDDGMQKREKCILILTQLVLISLFFFLSDKLASHLCLLNKPAGYWPQNNNISVWTHTAYRCRPEAVETTAAAKRSHSNLQGVFISKFLPGVLTFRSSVHHNVKA